jgi:hypothetical protein
MKKEAFFLIIGFLFAGTFTVFAQQKSALRQPACLMDSTKEAKIDQMISTLPKVAGQRPWIVYSNRGDDYGTKYYVTRELPDLTNLEVYAGSGSNGLNIQNPRGPIKKAKKDLLLHFSAEFTPGALIHRKCVVLNSQGLVDSICQGLIEESKIPVYHSPYSREIVGYLPLYSIYFLYQVENKRYLLGRDYYFKPEFSFDTQIIGWVDANRVFNYDNRLCFEPNAMSGAVQHRRCDTVFGNAKVFSTSAYLGVFLDKNKNTRTIIDPLWEEPDTMYLKPQIKSELYRERVSRKALRGAVADRCAHNLGCFTNVEMPANYFRFPFLGLPNKSDNRIFKVAATGKYIRSRQTICESLSLTKKKLNVFFIFPDSIPASYSVFFLNQLNQQYSYFSKKYNACFFPAQKEYQSVFKQSGNEKKVYGNLLDSLMNQKPSVGSQSDPNCFSTLNQVLENEDFNNQETNLIVIINNSKKPVSDNNNTVSIAKKLAEKNCYLLTFDLVNNPSFATQLDEIMQKAIDNFNQLAGLEPVPYVWEQKGQCRMLTNNLLATAWSIDTTELKGPQILQYIETAYEPLLSTITRVINAQCDSKTDTMGLSVNETGFWQALESRVPTCKQSISSMRILQEGYTCMNYVSKKTIDNTIWQAEVLMTQGELTSMITMIEGLTTDQSSTNTNDRICDLWYNIVSRFIGETWIAEDKYLDLNITQLLDKIMGVQFGYPSNEKIKKNTLRVICQGSDEIKAAMDEYQNNLLSKRQRLLAIFRQAPFQIERENNETSTINYYWVPVYLMP